MQAEEQGQVAVDSFALQHFGGADSLPGGGDLDQHALASNSLGVVLRDDRAGLRDGGRGGRKRGARPLRLRRDRERWPESFLPKAMASR